MTNREVMQQALDALETLSKLGNGKTDGNSIGNTIAQEAREHLFTALAQPEQEPVAWVCYGAPGKRDIDFEEADINGLPIGTNLYTTPPAAQPPPEWELIKNILDEYGLQAISFLAEWKAAQRPWVGLTDEEVQFYALKHSKLINVGYYKMTHTNVVTEAFDSTGFYKEVSAVLKERNT